MVTLTRSYETYEDARNVVVRLQRADVADSDISLVGQQETGDSKAATGAGIGGAAGGVAGLLAGIGAIAIPGIGPVVAVGWLASTITGLAAGALAGGLVGALTEAGVEERDAHYYAETVRRGGTVVSVRTVEERVPAIEAILDGAAPIDMASRRADYEREGWTQFDANATPYVRPPV